MSTPLAKAIEKAYDAVRDRGGEVRPTRWQSMDVSKQAAATTREVLNYMLQAPVHTEELGDLRLAIEPNLPWADDHFLERVGGKPLNPGVEWAHWPWGNSANSFRSENVPLGSHNSSPYDQAKRVAQITASEPAPDGYVKGFSHTYMERMWPKVANTKVMTRDAGIADGIGFIDRRLSVHTGIRYPYGDASDVVDHLLKAPDSRQAYLPIWFPEDTGKLDVRVPCTLGYHFIQRHGYLHCTYYIRSCDLYRHFRDDVYLTVRLQLWMLEELRKRQADPGGSEGDVDWLKVKPGMFTMHIVSLHAFINDFRKLFPKAP